MLSKLKSAFKTIELLYEANTVAVVDNYHLISDTYLTVKREKRLIKKSCYLYKEARSYFEKSDGVFTEKDYVGFLLSKRDEYEFNIESLRAFELLLKMVCLEKISVGEMCVDFLRELTRADLCSLDEYIFPLESLLEKEESWEYMDKKTKSLYRKRLCDWAKKKRISLKKARTLLESSNITIGETLFGEKKSIKPFVFSALLFLVFQTTAFFFAGWLSFVLAIPIFFSCEEIVDLFLSKLQNEIPTLRLDVTKLQERVPSLVVITSLLSDSDRLFENVEAFYLSNKSSKAFFGLLLDHPDSTEPEHERSENTKHAIAEITRLNKKYGPHFCLFLRHSVLNSEGKYHGWERKRGAVVELCRFLRGKQTTISTFVGDKTELEKTKYLLTLDSDTRLSVDSVNDILGAMLHPLYRPKLKNGKIVKGYGIMQPSMATSISSSLKTPFSALMSENVGTDIYNGGSYDRYMNCFSEGAFCGKGMIDVELFEKLVSLPEGFVLSHDLPEGAVMRTRPLLDVTLSDSIPKNMLAHSTRSARWCRGDVQNLWLLSKISSFVGKYMIINNVLRALDPVLKLFAIISSLFLESSTPLVVLTLLVLVIPSLLSVVISPSYFLMLTKRRTFTKITKNATKRLLNTLWKLASLCYEATNNLRAMLLSLIRMTVTKKKRLEWVTASEIDKSGKGGLFYHTQRMFSSFVIGSLLFFFGSVGITRLLGVVWFSFPIISYLVSLPLNTTKKYRNKEWMTLECAKMLRFFFENVGDTTNHLPPDNVSFYMGKRVAMRTSPTNIGLYLTSLVSGRKLGLITKKELEKRLKNTLQTLQKLEKYHGHLYNWYDLETLQVIGGRYVSTVDSGNFLVCVTTLVEALRVLGETELAKEYESLLNADLLALYNEKRELFYLGYNESEGKFGDICYDLYMSEARMTSYLAVATGAVKRSHWKRLSRTLIESNGYIGMGSWTGTAFEYFMPTLFLETVKTSFPNEALLFAYEEQRANTHEGLWGISESGYFEFDHEQNYAYKAFGVASLALKSYQECENVFSPYSAFLMMPYGERAALSLFERYESIGASGKYGFYEAVDMRDGVNVIKSYMSHHLGMSIAALTNMICDNFIKNCFMSNVAMNSAKELLEERIPDVGVFKNITPKKKKPPVKKLDNQPLKSKTELPDSVILFGGGLTAIVTENGNVSLKCGETLVNDCNFAHPIPDKTISFGLDDDVRVIPNESSVSLVDTKKEKSVTLSIIGDCFSISMLSKTKENVLEFDVVLNEKREHYSHPTFSNLFVSSFFDEKTKTLFFERRSQKNAKKTFLAVTTENSEPFCFKTRRNGETGETGSCLYPSLQINMNTNAKLLLCVAQSTEDALELINNARKTKISTARTLSDEASRETLSKMIFSGVAIGTTTKKRPLLFENSISGDLPIYFLNAPSPTTLFLALEQFLHFVEAGVRYDLVVNCDDEDVYSKEKTRLAKKMIHHHALTHFVSKNGGIHLLSSAACETNDYLTLIAFNTKKDVNLKTIPLPSAPKRILPPPPNAFETRGGYFDENGFVMTDVPDETKWSFLLTSASFGCLVTNNDLGYSYFINSKKGRITRFSGDVYDRIKGETVSATVNGKSYDLALSSSSVSVMPDKAEYKGEIMNKPYKLTITVAKKLPAKFIEVECDDSFELEYRVLPNERESFIDKKTGFVVSLFRELCFCVGTIEKKTISFPLTVSSKGKTTFFLCASKNQASLNKVLELLTSKTSRANTPLPKLKISFGSEWADRFFSKLLPYQIYASRFRARCGYFQTSGAFGFRDQLQDSMALCYLDKKLSREHIIRCSARQYEDGSVNHWFFPEGEGVKTKCSDDFMYLPWACAYYVEFTEDESILDVKTEYLVSPPLSNENERFEIPNKSGVSVSVYDHCMRSLKKSLTRGENGLPPLGSCDWNDGFSAFGGESVLCAMQYIHVYEQFCVVMRKRGDHETARFFENESNELRKTLLGFFEDDRYIRAVGENGKTLGSKKNDECSIDLTVQAFAVIANVGTKAMQKKAMETAWQELYDEKLGVLRLFAPSFEKDDRSVGYIQGYVEGIRENGGQYTHAAVWALIALVKLGETKRALTLLRSLCPSWRSFVGGEITKNYLLEPYALCGDVYYSKKFKGRGGWSHYTGSAAWYYRAIVEYVMGITLSANFKIITVSPIVEYEATLDYFGKIKIISLNGKNETTLDGKNVTFPLTLDGKDHVLVVKNEKIHRFIG